jgi:hypothetical protein
MNDDLLHEIVYDSGVLVDVVYYYFYELDRDPCIIELFFEKQKYYIEVNGEFDTVELKKEIDPLYIKKECYQKEYSSEFPWKNAIGKQVMWGWRMFNQQGYEDGIQFEFGLKDNQQVTYKIQLMGLCSTFDISTVEKVPKLKKL